MTPIRHVPAASAAAFLALSVLAAAPAGAVEVERVVSPGGIEAWLVENPRVPVISMEFAFRGGIELDPPGKEGLANLVSILLDEGAGDLDSAEFQRRLADSAIGLGFDAGTDAFYGSLSTTSAYADEAFDLLRLALTQPRFDADPIERMREATLAEIRGRVGDPGWIARRVLYETIFPGHPYGRPSRGTVPTLTGLARDDLTAFVAERFTRANLVVGVSGDITPEALGPVLDEVFGALPEGTPAPEVPDVAQQAGGSVLLVDRPGAQSVMLMSQPGVDRASPDYYPSQILNYVLGGAGFGSRLTSELREARGLTYGVSSYLVDFDHADLLMVSSDLSNANVPEAVDLIRSEWRRMAEEGVTPEELADAKTFLTGSFPLQFTSTGAVASILRGMQLEDLGIDYLDRRNDLLEAVTLDQVNGLAGRLLDPDALAMVIVGDPDAEALKPTMEVDLTGIVGRELGMLEDSAPAPSAPAEDQAPPPAGRS